MNENLPISGIKIHHFRGINDLEIDNLSQVNILVGANNCGKTSVLEALELFSSPSYMAQLLTMSLSRITVSSENPEYNLDRYMLNIFQKLPTQSPDTERYLIDYEVTMNANRNCYRAIGVPGEIIAPTGEAKKSLDITIDTLISGERTEEHHTVVRGEFKSYRRSGNRIYKTKFLKDDLRQYKFITEILKDSIVDNRKPDVLQILQSFDPNIYDISIVGSEIYLHNTYSGSLPLFVYGSGLQKAVAFTAAIAQCQNGVILIDEIDNALHISAFEDVFRWFLKACKKWNVQAFVTTHSAEAVDAILEVAHEDHPEEDLLRVITLRKDYKNHRTRKIVRTGEEAYEDRSSYQMELRV